MDTAPGLLTSSELIHPKYRPDIDGLRAIAVISVVAYHAFPNSIRGGFIGVDIFFVISGFLISTIIFVGLERGNFSFATFYSRRVRRIFPALLLMLVACYAFGWFSLLADEYKQLGKHIAAGASFVSNYALWSESGYFDNAADTKPLQHLWSLGIEEQFYIVWPLLLWLAHRQRISLLAVTLVMAGASFLLDVAEVDRDAMAAFYSPQARFWELSSGSLLAYLTLHKGSVKAGLTASIGKEKFDAIDAPLHAVLSVSGILLIAAGLLVISRERHFPGWWALLPTLGAVLVISGGAHAPPNRFLLSNRVLVWIGLISFPLYIWHWPLLSFARIVESAKPSIEIRVVAVLLSCLLAWLTYEYLEKPIRFGAHGKSKTLALLAFGGLVAVLGYDCYKRDGLDGTGFRVEGRQEYANYFANGPPEKRYLRENHILEKYRVQCDFYDIEKSFSGKATAIPRGEISAECFSRDARYSNSVLIWGDSHAQQFYYGLKENLPANWQILQVATSGCTPGIDAKGPSDTDWCVQSNWFALKTIESAKPDVVVVGQNDGHSVSSFTRIAEELKRLGVKRVVFAGPTPHWTSRLPDIIVRKLWTDTPARTYFDVDKAVMTENAALREGSGKFDLFVFVDVIGVFCSEAGCLTYIGDDRKTGITTWDYGHLTPIASDYLAKKALVSSVIGESSKPQ